MSASAPTSSDRFNSHVSFNRARKIRDLMALAVMPSNFPECSAEEPLRA
jgi:hypothetical protein